MRPSVAQIIAFSTIMVMTLTGGALATIAIDDYFDARVSAQHELNALRERADAVLQDVRDVRRHAGELQRIAHAAVTHAAGKTLDDSAPNAVRDAIARLERSLPAFEAEAFATTAASLHIAEKSDSLMWWPPNVSAAIHTVSFPNEPTGITDAVAILQKSLADLSDAQQQWQAEQERLAAEAAAAAAAAARSTTKRSGSSAQWASRGAVTRVTPYGSVEAVVATFEPRATISWEAGYCDGWESCGTTSLGGANPIIRLDSNLRDEYLGTRGMYVLMHEIAHARSWFKYGSWEALLSASTALMTNGLSGTAAVEYMADCATLAKIGYSLGTYTASCTPEQLAEGASYW